MTTAVDTPLAVCDARSVAAEDLVAADIHYPSRRGEIYLVRHSPSHAWAYFPGMDRDEALVFKQYDSRRDVARFVREGADVVLVGEALVRDGDPEGAVRAMTGVTA